MTDPERAARGARTVAALDGRLVGCRACPRLVAWREEVARVKRAAFADQEYWGRPVPGLGPTDAKLALVGLASQPTAVSADDGLALHGTRITAPVHCAPPDNKPTPAERDTCRPWLARELQLLAPTLRAVVVLGGFGWQALLPVLAAAGWTIPRPRPRFAHGTRLDLPGGPSPLTLFGCYHVSQQNTFTGRLTPAMLEAVLSTARGTAGL
jgi:uracil-DNA glycosylase